MSDPGQANHDRDNPATKPVALAGLPNPIPVPGQPPGFDRQWRAWLLMPAALREVGDENSEGFLTDMVFEAFGVGLGRPGRHAERLEEGHDDFVPAPRFVGELAAGRREKNRPIRLRGDQPGPLEAADGPADSDVGHTQPPRQVDGARLAARGDEVGDGLDIVLRDFLRVRGPRPLEIVSERQRARVGGFGRRAIHLNTKAEKPQVDNPETICSISYIMKDELHS